MKTFFSPNNEKGFTLIEMVFVFVIFAIMASITLFNFRGFNTKLQFNNLTQDVALRVVSAQKSAISGATNINFIGQAARPSYGVYFKAATTATTDSTQFIYFNDLPDLISGTGVGDKFYNPSGGPCPSSPVLGNECLSVTAITTGEFVSNVCYLNTGATLGTCASGGAANIVFTRPFPDAALSVDTGSIMVLPQQVCIELTSGSDTSLKKTISISNLGEIRTHDGAASLAPSPCRT